MNLEEKSINDLLRLNSQTIEELIKRGVLRTRNNPIGDYTEWIVSKKLNLVLEKNSKSGYDAIDKRGIKFQIKGRRIKSSNKSKQLGVIRNLQLKKFDYLVGLIFNEI